MSRVYQVGAEDETAPLWASLAMEHLLKAALASIHPALIIDTKNRDEHLLVGFGAPGPAKGAIFTISASLAISRAVQLIDGFVDEDAKIASVLAGARNDELHSGVATFRSFTPAMWEGKFYKAAIPLIAALGRSLADFVGTENTQAAQSQADAVRDDLRNEAHALVKKAKEFFAALQLATPAEVPLRIQAAKLSLSLAQIKKAKVVQCPACANLTAVLYGVEVTRKDAELSDSDLYQLIVMLPTRLHCEVCELELSGLSKLDALGLSGRYDVTDVSSLDDLYAEWNADYDRDDDY